MIANAALALAAALVLAGVATPGRTQDDAALAALPQARLAGAGRLTFFGLPVYQARLWVPPGFERSRFEQHPVALELTYRRDFRSADIARRSLQEMRRHGRFDEAQARVWQATLQSLLPDVVDGDRLLGVHRPGRGAAFFHNGRSLGEVPDAQFARLFFAIWLGPQTSEPALRDALLEGTPP